MDARPRCAAGGARDDLSIGTPARAAGIAGRATSRADRVALPHLRLRRRAAEHPLLDAGTGVLVDATESPRGGVADDPGQPEPGVPRLHLPRHQLATGRARAQDALPLPRRCLRGRPRDAGAIRDLAVRGAEATAQGPGTPFRAAVAASRIVRVLPGNAAWAARAR